jgi:hypothetical protein
VGQNCGIGKFILINDFAAAGLYDNINKIVLIGE